MSGEDVVTDPVTHVVLVQWRAGTAPDEVSALVAAVHSMTSSPDAIEGIDGLVEGPSRSPEGLEDGFDWSLVITFRDEAARDAYLPHPRHRVVAEAIGRLAERVVVFDV